MTAALVLAVLLAAAEEPPRVRPLDPGPPAAAPDTPARRLPPLTTVCRDAATGRCWTEPGETDCGRPASGATVFRVVIAGPGRDDAARAVAECRAGPPRPYGPAAPPGSPPP